MYRHVVGAGSWAWKVDDVRQTLCSVEARWITKGVGRCRKIIKLQSCTAEFIWVVQCVSLARAFLFAVLRIALVWSWYMRLLLLRLPRVPRTCQARKNFIVNWCSSACGLVACTTSRCALNLWCVLWSGPTALRCFVWESAKCLEYRWPASTWREWRSCSKDRWQRRMVPSSQKRKVSVQIKIESVLRLANI